MAERAVVNWDPPKMHNLAKEYVSMREEIWSGLAARVGEDWRVVEEKVCNNILFLYHISRYLVYA